MTSSMTTKIAPIDELATHEFLPFDPAAFARNGRGSHQQTWDPAVAEPRAGPRLVEPAGNGQ